jgi:hypothetical protein
MSDIGVLSQDYQNTADLFRAINQAVILVKKRFYELTGAAQVSDKQLSQARQSLAGIINELLDSLETRPGKDGAERPGESDEDEPAGIPAFLIRRIEGKHQGDLHLYLEDLRALHHTLDYDGILTEEQIGYLDELCEQFDAETSALHRKLWRK